jgi:hypothetical protein
MTGAETKKSVSWIEWLVIGLLVGLLGLLAIWAISSARTMARDAVRLSDVRQVQTGLELYFNDHNTYPEVTDVLPLGQATTFCLSDDGFSGECDASEVLYLESVAMPPANGLRDSVCDGAEDAYCYIGAEASYRIQFELEKDQPLLGLEKGLNCATETGLESGVCGLPDGFEVTE